MTQDQEDSREQCPGLNGWPESSTKVGETALCLLRLAGESGVPPLSEGMQDLFFELALQGQAVLRGEGLILQHSEPADGRHIVAAARHRRMQSLERRNCVRPILEQRDETTHVVADRR